MGDLNSNKQKKKENVIINVFCVVLEQNILFILSIWNMKKYGIILKRGIGVQKNKRTDDGQNKYLKETIWVYEI